MGFHHDADLRPASLDEFCGQPKLRERLKVKIEAAKLEMRPLEHILLDAPPGSGKTSLAYLIAQEMEDEIESFIMPVPDRTLTGTVQSFSGVLFLDEIHRASNSQQEVLLPLLESGYMERNGQRIENDWLTVVCATTEPKDVIPPLHDRFGFVPMFEPYSPEDLAQIVKGMAQKAGLDLGAETVMALGHAAGGVPRHALRLIHAARDLWAIKGTEPDVDEILDLSGCFKDGLTEQHVAYLTALDGLGGTAGVNLLASALRMHPRVCENLEQRLREKKLIVYTPKGRTLTAHGMRRIRSNSKKMEKMNDR